MRSSDQALTTKVTCYAGTGYPERPRSFSYGGERLEVAAVEQRERTPRGMRFRVRATDGRCFWLLYDETADAWDIAEAQRRAEQGDCP